MGNENIQNKVFYYMGPREMELVCEPCGAPQAGQVRCRTLCSLVSIGTEMICFERDVEPGSIWDKWIEYPFEPGYSSVGEVVDIGPGVTGIAPGDRVCSTSAHRAYFIDRPENLHRIPDGLAPELAAWFQLNIIVQNGIRESAPALGETGVVIGLGPLGQLAVRLLGIAGLNHLVAVDPVAERCELARENGPTELLCQSADKALEKISGLTRGEGADLVFDITGHPSVFHSAQHMLRKRGRLGLIGDVAYPSRQTLTHDVISNSISIIAAHGAVPPWEGNAYYRWGKKELVRFFFDLLLAGRIRIDNLITHRIKPEQAPGVYLDILRDRGSYMGVVIDWQ